MVSPTRIQMTLDEFFALPETMTPTELFDGEMIVSPAPAFRHQAIAATVFTCVNNLKPDGTALFAPVDVVLNPGTVAQPDVLWVSSSNERCMEQDGKLFGPPDLCIEILSPSTARKDRTKKFNAYESAGVREFWIIEPTLNSLEQWVLNDNEFGLQGVYHEPQTFVSPALNGATVALSDIFPQTT
jgi:Uma2 family endonuclease